MPSPPGSRIAVVVKGYPRLSETFIAQELLGLERRGLDLVIVSLRHPTDPAVHPVHQEIRAPILYLPEYLRDEPLRVWRAWRSVRRSSTYEGVRRLWLADVRRDPTPNRGRRFGQALVLAAELPAEVGLIYGHYLHTPASVARYAAALTDRPLCLSAHAKDLWITPAREKRDKLLASRFVTTCTRHGRDHLQALAPGARVLLNHHGLDPARFPAPGRGGGPDGRDPAHPVRLLGVARLVPKKGLDVLLEALARLPRELAWRYAHIGAGPGRADLERLARDLGIADRITWHGARSQAEVLDAYRGADLCVLASRIAADGDRDGLPNVLMEAASQELALVASDVAAVPELIEHGSNGLLVRSEDPDALRQALETLIRDPERRLALGRAARRTVVERFAAAPGLDRLAAELRAVLGAARDRAA
ncbi:MAG TPA: glycosyltransferase family 4 protein [Geminicoccaceae bacterium]